MGEFAIISETSGDVVTHTKTLPDGKTIERIGDHGYNEIIRLIVATQSDEKAREFRIAVDRELDEGKKVQLQIEEFEETKKLRLRSINLIQTFSSIESFVLGSEMSDVVDNGRVPKF